MTTENKRDDELGALWEKTNDKGQRFMTGSVVCTNCNCKQDVVLFPNQFKTKENHPSWRILKSRPKDERTSTRRDEAVYQKPVAEEFDSRQRPQETWPPRGQQRLADRKPDYVKPVNGAKNADWTNDAPPPVPVDDSDIPF